jgi:hypothetical protein
MAGSTRTLKLSLLADVAGLSKGLTQGSNEVQGFGWLRSQLSGRKPP